jgi:squalene-hopene/tetraprenyl-beta-curcumene cyclase
MMVITNYGGIASICRRIGQLLQRKGPMTILREVLMTVTTIPEPQAPPRPGTEPLNALTECRVRLRAHLTGHVGNDGGVRDRCASRVLESSIMLFLLRAEDSYPAAQRGIADYLRKRARTSYPGRDGAALDALETALVDAVLSERPTTADSAFAFLDAFDHFTSPRKRFMFHTLLTELGAAESSARFDLESVGYDEYATWVNLQMCALKILRAYQCGRPQLATAADRDFLMTQLASGSSRRIFEADVFAHLVALLAARRVQPGTPLVSAGIEYLLRAQNPDGGLPFIAGWEPFVTAVCALALAAGGANPALIEQMAEFVAAHQGRDGGWPFAPGVHQSDADCSPYCLQLLRVAAPRRFAGQIARAEQYLAALVNEDGGFGTYRRGDPSEVGVTGCAALALAPARDQFAATLGGAVAFLLRRQRPDGTFERGWSLSEANAMFRAMLALRHCADETPEITKAAIRQAFESCARYLISAQNSDGGWGQCASDPSDVLSTSYSILALDACGTTGPVPAAHEYLLAQQQSDGGYVSIPDSAGPRPIPHDVPVLADAFALLALGRPFGELLGQR